MTIRVKKRDMTSLVLMVVLILPTLLLINSNAADAACGGSNIFTLRVFDPNSVQLRSGSDTITPVTGDSDPCSTATSNSVGPLNIQCQIGGSYTADVTCTSCAAGHTVSSTTVVSCLSPEKNKLMVKNITGGNIAAFDSKGYVYLKGFNHSNQASLSPTPNSYIIRNNTGKVIAYINSSGSLFITGSVSMSQTAVSAPLSSFIIRNGTRKDVAYIDSSGNLVLAGKLYYNWTDTI